MRIVSLNTWHANRRPELRDFLLSQIDSTDIFCLQETVGEAIESLISELFSPDEFVIETTEKFIIEENHYSSHTIVKKPYKILSSQPLLDPSDPNVGSILAVTVESDGQPLVVVNVHGVPQPGHKLDTAGRIRQSKKILDWLKSSELPAVICGDFNLMPETESITIFTSTGYCDLIAKYKIPTTRNQLAWSQHPVKQLYADYTFVSPNLRVTDFAVPNIEVSDHLPMITKIAD